MGAMYFVIHANVCVPVFFLGVGGRVRMCHSCALELSVCSWGVMLSPGHDACCYPSLILRGRKQWGSKEDGGQQEKLDVK